MMVKLTARQRSQLPTCYYEGYLEKRSFKDKTSLKLWTCLCGNTLFFFNEKRDADYVEKVDLGGFVSITDDSSQGRNLDAARLCLQMKDGNVRFILYLQAPNAEARELWKGYIRSVAELSVPISLNLLPGQIHMLKETVKNEKLRINYVPPPAAVTSSSSPDGLQADRPACFHNVSRLEAELLLERETQRGNLLLRPGSKGNSYAVTTRQDLEGAVIRHYRVTPELNRGFVIDVDNPVLCATLHDVINYLVGRTDGFLTPLITEEAYERNIFYIGRDFENGERSVREATTSPAPPSVPPKTVSPRIPTPEHNLYLNDELEELEEETEDLSTAALPQLEKKTPKKAMMPPVLVLASAHVSAPVPVPRTSVPSTSSTSSTSSTNRLDQRMNTITDPQRQIPLATISELKRKFEQNAHC